MIELGTLLLLLANHFLFYLNGFKGFVIKE